MFTFFKLSLLNFFLASTLFLTAYILCKTLACIDIIYVFAIGEYTLGILAFIIFLIKRHRDKKEVEFIEPLVNEI